MNQTTIGSYITKKRREKNLTQEQLAQKLGLTKSVISAYETGSRQPSYDVLVRLSRIFKVTTDYLLNVAPQNQNQMIDLSGLTLEEVKALTSLIRAMKNR